jgi:hypothetical protein
VLEGKLFFSASGLRFAVCGGAILPFQAFSGKNRAEKGGEEE